MRHSRQRLQSAAPCARARPTRKRNVLARSDRDPREGNVDGQFFVDHTCIDCDTCRWMAPDSFARVGSQSSVVKQPTDRSGRVAAIQATLSCPTFSIHMRHKDGAELREAQAGMPIPVPECPGVYHCGFHSEKSFGATSYLIKREEGNIMMDCPRFNPKLAKNIEAMGGVSTIVLSHIDDISDHDKWAAHFGAPRIIHSDEIRASIRDVEIQLQGTGPWNLRGEGIGEQDLDGGVQLVHTPGHTTGCITMWHAPTKTVFTGDHFGYSLKVDRATIFPRYNRAGKELQVESVQKLLNFDWLHVLPGHGRRFHIADAAERLQVVNATADAELALAK